MMTKPWGDVRAEITRLYITEARTLKEVQEIMRARHAFVASIRSYRQQFDNWGVDKYKCKKREMRRKKAAARSILPTPPITPMVGTAPAPVLPSARIGPPQRLPQFPCAPSRTNSSSSDSSVSSSFSVPSLASSISESPRLAPRVPYSATSPRAHRYFDTQPVTQLSYRVKTRCLTSEDPPAGIWGESDFQSVLRSPQGMSDMSLSLAPYRLGYPDITTGTKGSTKLLPGLEITHDPEWPRHGGSYHLYSAGSDYDRVPYQDAMPRTIPDSPYTRPSLYQTVPSLESLPRLIKVEPGFEIEEAGRLGYGSPVSE